MAKITPLDPYYVRLPDIPRPEPSQVGSRAEWLDRERQRARTHLVNVLTHAEKLPTARVGDPRNALASLERALKDDCYSLEYERDLWAKLGAARSAMEELLDHLWMPPPDEEAMGTWKVTSDDGGRQPAPVRRFINRMVARSHYPIFDDNRDVLDGALSTLIEIQGAIGRTRHPTESRPATSTQETPSLERFARRCLSFGVGPREAAMIEAIVETRPGRASTPALWFDSPTAAYKRWRQAYERIADRSAVAEHAEDDTKIAKNAE